MPPVVAGNSDHRDRPWGSKTAAGLVRQESALLEGRVVPTSASQGVAYVLTAPGPLPAECSELASPWFEKVVNKRALTARKNRADLLQLAHYQSMLEAAGLAAADGRCRGILGTEEEVIWYGSTGSTMLRSTPKARTPSQSASLRRSSPHVLPITSLIDD